MPPISKWKIPYKMGSAEYQQCLRKCRRLGKPWPELTEQEQKLSAPYPSGLISISQSVQKVRAVLKEEETMELTDIVQESRLGVRTVRYALKQLKDQDLIVERFNWKDARKTLYMLKPEAVVDKNEGRIR